MEAGLRQLVWARAGDRCEYCKMPQEAVDVTFYVEHIVARKHHGNTEAENLALSCNRCNLHNSNNLSGIDPDTRK